MYNWYLVVQMITIICKRNSRDSIMQVVVWVIDPFQAAGLNKNTIKLKIGIVVSIITVVLSHLISSFSLIVMTH